MADLNYSNGGGSGSTDSGGVYSDEVTDLLGEEHLGVKGKAAIAKMLVERNGHVKGAFYSEWNW